MYAEPKHVIALTKDMITADIWSVGCIFAELMAKQVEEGEREKAFSLPFLCRCSLTRGARPLSLSLPPSLPLPFPVPVPLLFPYLSSSPSPSCSI